MRFLHIERASIFADTVDIICCMCNKCFGYIVQASKHKTDTTTAPTTATAWFFLLLHCDAKRSRDFSADCDDIENVLRTRRNSQKRHILFIIISVLFAAFLFFTLISFCCCPHHQPSNQPLSSPSPRTVFELELYMKISTLQKKKRFKNNRQQMLLYLFRRY